MCQGLSTAPGEIYLEASVQPTSVRTGDPLTITALLENKTAEADCVTLTISLSKDGSPLRPFTVFLKIGPEEKLAHSLTKALPTFMPAGAYEVILDVQSSRGGTDYIALSLKVTP